MSKLYADITNISQIESVSVSTSHSSSMSSAVINCISHSTSIGDEITIDLGYTTNHAQIFKGYVKQIERVIPSNAYTITAHDVMVRAVDFFVVSTNPEDKFVRRNIQAENLVQDVLQLAGLSSFDLQSTQFTLAIGADAEVSLVGAYDYCKGLADLLAWHLWADSNGVIHFRNRKPYVMYNTSGQPGYGQPGNTPDTSMTTITDAIILNFNYIQTEKDLRNRIVVWGTTDIFAEADRATSYDPADQTYKQVLPSGYYKAVAFVSELIGTTSNAQKAADYNLDLLNRLKYRTTISVEGDPTLIARNVITLDEDLIGIDKLFYIFMSEHAWNKSGYVCNMELVD
ncbi:hypothetical protein LCGC14_0609700 [marine sediment metagenome]|uniref:Uncharacterized protein n=1 Tax=marine sediment metagenome TaxID=412755 RepID=A0A0F9UGI0_9ZZZZ